MKEEQEQAGIPTRSIKTAFKDYILMFDDGRELVKKKSSERGRLTPSQVSQLLRKPPGAHQRLLRRWSSPPRVEPNIPSTDDRELVDCLDQYEIAHQHLCKYKYVCV
ncbi:uncharacterized protein [Argopecten irradians]|uniref:uncharacterized protein n=1 Tax=Argopecten irradians TaxID=31199 RepID=UPI00371959D1